MKACSSSVLVSVLSCAASSVAAADAAQTIPTGRSGSSRHRAAAERHALAVSPEDVEKWGQSVIVDNRGTRGLSLRARANGHTDGYRWCRNGAGLTINRACISSSVRSPARLPAITPVTSGAYFMVVPRRSRQTVVGILALAKPTGQLNSRRPEP